MKSKYTIAMLLLLITGCTGQKKLAYLNNLPESKEPQYFTLSVPEYKVHQRDVLYITAKALDPDGKINDFLGATGSSAGASFMMGDGSGYLIGYNVDKDGNLILPVIGKVKVEGLTLYEIRELLQKEFSKTFRNAIVDCKLMSYKITVIGEVKSPGSYITYNDYLTVFEAIGKAGGIDDYGRRDRILVVRSVEDGTKTFTINLQDKNILSNEAYILQPNDVVIVQPQGHKIFNLNFPTFSSILVTLTSVITTTILLLAYLKK